MDPICSYDPSRSTNSNEQRSDALVCQSELSQEPSMTGKAGVTSSGDSVYAEAALTRHIDDTYTDARLFNAGRGESSEGGFASIQVGLQNEIAIGVYRNRLPAYLTGDGTKPKGSVAGTNIDHARLHVGIHNDDGSTGFNLGASVKVLDGTSETPNSHVSFGLTLAAGLSIGRRTGEDGKQETCWGVELPFVSFGQCK